MHVTSVLRPLCHSPQIVHLCLKLGIDYAYAFDSRNLFELILDDVRTTVGELRDGNHDGNPRTVCLRSFGNNNPKYNSMGEEGGYVWL